MNFTVSACPKRISDHERYKHFRSSQLLSYLKSVPSLFTLCILLHYSEHTTSCCLNLSTNYLHSTINPIKKKAQKVFTSKSILKDHPSERYLLFFASILQECRVHRYILYKLFMPEIITNLCRYFKFLIEMGM